MNPGDDEAAENKEEVDADIEILQMPGKGMLAVKTRLRHDVAGMVQNDEACCERSAHLQRYEPRPGLSPVKLVPAHEFDRAAAGSSFAVFDQTSVFACTPQHAEHLSPPDKRHTIRIAIESFEIALPRASAFPTGTSAPYRPRSRILRRPMWAVRADHRRSARQGLRDNISQSPQTATKVRRGAPAQQRQGIGEEPRH